MAVRASPRNERRNYNQHWAGQLQFVHRGSPHREPTVVCQQPPVVRRAQSDDRWGPTTLQSTRLSQPCGIAIARPARQPTRKQSRGSCHEVTTGVIEMSPLRSSVQRRLKQESTSAE
jgi:hypothetical protein